MAKASFIRPDGTKITIEGDADEVSALIEILEGSLRKVGSSSRAAGAKTKLKRPSRRSGAPTRPGPTGNVLRLRDEGFFEAKRTLGDLRNRLEEGGHIYALTDLSPILTRLVRQRQLRRLKENGKWKYVNV